MQYNKPMQNIYQAKGSTFVQQYYDAGELFASSIQNSVGKLAKSRRKLIVKRRLVADKTWENLKDRSECSEFVQCLKSWSLGAQIKPNEAMWLLADNLSGCQTMMVRYTSGVALLHAEEEFRDSKHIELHMTSPHTMAFFDGSQVLKTLVYNDLLPGAGLYGWKQDMIVAVDSLFLTENGIENVQNPLLANIVSWLIWRMDPREAEPDKIIGLIKSLGEVVDGYAINVVRKVDTNVEGYKLIIARDETKIVRLGMENGSALVQVNIIDPQEWITNRALPPKKIWRGGWRYFKQRIQTLGLHAKVYRKWCLEVLKPDQVEDVHYKIQEVLYAELASHYVNADLGAMAVGLVDIRIGTSVSCKLNDGKSIQIVEYVDMINAS